ncbi:hypothetical protein WN944_025478 [Citrus x changshan-huyou]|uniref:Uncharacterized protein n=1 Tax=Citrus x changshan-huyou TaxID=2935761 RepID=A0AAP0LUH7_9ROSI
MSITELFALWRRFNELALLYYQSIDDFGLSASSSFDRLLPAQALSSHTNGRTFRMPEKVVFRYSGKVSERQWWPW